MAETTTPSVRGRIRLEVAGALAAGAVWSAGLAGLAFGVTGAAARAGWQWAEGGPIAPLPVSVVGAMVTAALALDLTVLVRGRPRPFTLGRQVPQQWGRLFDPRLVAALYGARLGVGPLTILSTWTWWAAMMAAAGIGVWTSVATSVWFAATRVVLNELVAVRLNRGPGGHGAVHGEFHARWFRRLIGVQNPSRLAINALTLSLVVAVVTAGCGQGSTPTVQDAAPTTTTTVAPSTTTSVRPSTRDVPPTSLAYLEDVVRTSTSTTPTAENDGDDGLTGPATAIEPSIDDPAKSAMMAEQSANPEALSAALPAGLLGMAVVDDPAGDRYLTLQQAADIQPDPIEETALLETRGYQGGWIRAFRAETNDIVVTSVYQFDDATEAEFYLEDGLITIGGYGGQFFEVPSLPAIRGFKQSFEVDDEELTTLGGAFFHGARWYLLYIVGPPQTATPEVLVPALAELYATAIAA